MAIAILVPKNASVRSTAALQDTLPEHRIWVIGVDLAFCAPRPLLTPWLKVHHQTTYAKRMAKNSQTL